MMLPHLPQHLTLLFARGGGGGSGGGGGGGGGSYGGGSSGGGDATGYAGVLLGLIPMIVLMIWLRKKLSRPASAGIGAVALIAYILIFMRGGAFGLVVIAMACIGFITILFMKNDFIASVASSRAKQGRADLAKAGAQDATWTPEQVSARVGEIFTRFQADWSSFNIASIRTYVAEPYATHVGLMLRAIQLRHRRNDMQDVVIEQLAPVEVDDEADNRNDRVVYEIRAHAHDTLLETIDGVETKLFTDNGTFTELWHLVRSGDTWMLESIEETTEDISKQNNTIKAFAEANGYFYALDWGWLLLPRHGVLFKHGAFGVSDINNHVIGEYNGLVVEIYTYVAKPEQNDKPYVIAQVALPKSYGSIIVEAKGGWGVAHLPSMTPKGYNAITLEWPDFNSRYNVYATDVEQATAFELLHPAYMEKLFALPFKVSMEVVDNVVYLYSQDMSAGYPTMLGLLKDAFAEMKI